MPDETTEYAGQPFKFRDRDHVIDKLVSDRVGGYDAWAWQKLVADLDGAGLVIVAKPVLREVGKPQVGP